MAYHLKKHYKSPGDSKPCQKSLLPFNPAISVPPLPTCKGWLRLLVQCDAKGTLRARSVHSARSRHQLINELLAHPTPTPALPKSDRKSKLEHSTVFPNSNRRDLPKTTQPAKFATRVAPPCQPPAEKSDRVKPDTKTHLTHKNIDF